MKKQNGSFRSNVGTPHALTVSLVPGTHFFTKLRNPRTTFRSSGFSSRTYALFLRFLPLPAFTGIPLHGNESRDVRVGHGNAPDSHCGNAFASIPGTSFNA